MKRLMIFLSLLSACASVPKNASPNWVDAFNRAVDWREQEAAFQLMQRHDHIRFIEQGLKIVGVAQNAGSNPPTGYEREAVIFWTAVSALHEWQEHPTDIEAKNRTLVGMRRLMELERLGWKVSTHTKWFVARAQEMEGAHIPQPYPARKAKWLFGASGFGSYELTKSDNGLHERISHEKSGGILGRTLAATCAVTILCRPMTYDRLTIREVNRSVHLTVLNSQGDPVRLRGLKPSPGEKETPYEEDSPAEKTYGLRNRN